MQDPKQEREAKMPVQDKLEIARAKLVAAALILTILAIAAGVCAPQLVHKTKIALTPAQVAQTQIVMAAVAAS